MKPAGDSFDSLMEAVRAASRDGTGVVVANIDPRAGSRILGALLRGKARDELSRGERFRRLSRLAEEVR